MNAASALRRTTRSSSARSSVRNNDESHPVPPPPPPPPPQQQPQRTATRRSTGVQTINDTWTLSVRTKRSPFLIHISVTPDMTSETLGQCILQATSAEPIDFEDVQLVGLFRVDTLVFCSLEHILSNPPDTGVIFSLYAPRREQQVVIPWYYQYQLLTLMACIVVALAYGYGSIAWDACWKTVCTAVDTLFYLPLKEWYRYAPGVLGGWEGAPLPAICARITYHGDEAFWARNVEECQRIYFLKEDAWLRFIKPLFVLGMSAVSLHVVRILVREHALRRRPAENRDMVETYQAFQMILRQVKRSLHSNTR